MAIDLGTLKVDMYDTCHDLKCRVEIGKAHIHPMQGINTMMHNNVVVRRVSIKEQIMQQLSIDMNCLELAPSNSDQRHTAKMMIAKLQRLIEL